MENFDLKKYLSEGKLLKNTQIEKGAINESILSTIALGAAIGLGWDWVVRKKKQLDRASDIADRIQGREDLRKADEDRIAAQEAALAQTETFLKDPKNQELINKIKNDPEVKALTTKLDQEYNKEYDSWERSGGGGVFSQGPMPYWGRGKEDIVKKIENKMKELGGEQLLNLMNKSNFKIGNLE